MVSSFRLSVQAQGLSAAFFFALAYYLTHQLCIAIKLFSFAFPDFAGQINLSRRWFKVRAFPFWKIVVMI